MNWIYLVLAGLLEIAFTTSMRHIDSALRPVPILAFLVCATLSFAFLIAAMRTIPLGTAYAVWTGIGAAGTVIIGIALYDEPATAWRIAFLTILIGAIVGLKLVSSG